ncbi:Histone-lysine N-methyltransferase mes-2 [Psilocybe cubensis]|uniref:Histone-lysine N-methyltransferase mes-2 n=1 Tax=Psilocybe cubensis TaxID=181762 RepID=A0ACB8GQN5_PSICU|nr:Histone-lysine N-methyltransferase mes-2 [Psilocybe cubensis]KAH9477320.1 Histone-lysine N-methyltransferase mes-2 [Psilocybe cubensis]
MPSLLTSELRQVHEDGKDAVAPAQTKSAERGNVPAFVLISNAIRRYAFHADLEEHGLCRNVGIQRGSFKVTEVRESKWGLGLFLSEPAETKELILEYVGEMIGPLTIDSRNCHAEHRNRSYVFELNPTFSLDSAYAGNQTRYMNHSAEEANCHTNARRIEEGEELLINYGSKFWPSDRLAQVELASAQAVPFPSYDDPTDLTYNEKEGNDLDS